MSHTHFSKRRFALLAAFTVPLIISPAFAQDVSREDTVSGAQLSPSSPSYRFSASAPINPRLEGAKTEPVAAATSQGKLDVPVAEKPVTTGPSKAVLPVMPALPDPALQPPDSAPQDARVTRETSTTPTVVPEQVTTSAPIPGNISKEVEADEQPRPIPIAVAPGTPLPVPVHAGGPIVVDSDLDKPAAKVNREKFEWKPLADKPGFVQLSAGTEFPVVSVSMLSSKTAKVGDRVEARLKMDLTIGGKLIAPKGARVLGHVSSCHPARRLLIAELKMHQRWMRANGALGLKFDEILTANNEHLPLNAIPAQRARIVNNHNEGRILGVNHTGQIASPLSIQLKHQGVHLAIRGAAAVGGVFTMGALPVAFGVIGAIDPSFAFMHPVGKNVHNRRLKGFGMGVLSGLPGGFIVADHVIKGVDAQVKPGDEFLVAFQKDFDGHVATEAELLPNASTKVKGEVLTKPVDKKSKKK